MGMNRDQRLAAIIGGLTAVLVGGGLAVAVALGLIGSEPEQRARGGVMAQTAGLPAAADGHPQLGSTHINGDRRFGITGPFSSVLAGRGTPMLSSLYHSTVTEHIGSVRVDDELHVEWRGTHWWATSDKGTVGRLAWSKGLRERTAYALGGPSPYDFDDGTLYVQHVTVSAAGEVVDCGGYVVPDNYEASDWPMTPIPDPAERELTITIGMPAPMTRPAPPAGETPPQASTETTTRSGWLRRLLGRD